jgi:diguanylate cyclase (GGDEF)-like protein
VTVEPETPPKRPASSPAEGGDPSIRRTWWLLAGAFFLLALTNGIRLVVDQAPLDWLTVALVVVAAVAAIAHRNAVAGLESRGRGEAEGFARILRGLSRSVSGEAIVSAIIEDVMDATAADHVVFVRERRDGSALDATLVTRRRGVPTTSAILPRSLLVPHDEDGAREPVAIPVGLPVGLPPATDGRASRVAGLPVGLPKVARRASDAGGGRTLLHRAAAETLALLRDVGLPAPDLLGIRGKAKPSEVLARGEDAVVVERLADRVRAVFGLAHTLTAPLRSVEPGVIGAIVLSRRDPEAWSESARRLVRGAATETAAALERADSFRAAERSASTDPLTGLPNRRYFDEYSTLLSRRRRAGDGVAVLMIDIDRFKGLNDMYGHPVGDVVLKSVAGAITAAVRDEDVPARIGGEEFAVVLRNSGPAVAHEVGERVRQAVRELDLAAVGVPGVSVSVGVANATSADEPIRALVDRADRALLRAKRSGRNRVVAG